MNKVEAMDSIPTMIKKLTQIAVNDATENQENSMPKHTIPLSQSAVSESQ